MSKPIASVVYALKAWTIKSHGEKFYIARSTARATWSKPYRSLQAACAAIARKHAEEWRGRHERHQTFSRLRKEGGR